MCALIKSECTHRVMAPLIQLYFERSTHLYFYFNTLTWMVAEISHPQVRILEKSLQICSSNYALFRRIGR